MSENLDDEFELSQDYLKFLNAEREIRIVQTVLSNLTDHFKIESKYLDSTDGILDTIQNFAESAQEEFEELVNVNTDKKYSLEN